MNENPSVVFSAPGRVEVRSLPMPEPGPGEVLIRTQRSLISTGTELTVLAACGEGEAWRRMTRFPFVPGYSNLGEVLSAGAGVDPDWVGKRVHNHGKHQAFTLSKADRLAEAPPAVDAAEATFATLAKVAMNALRRAGLTWGERVGVVGLGLLGQLACRLCRVAGARPIFAVEPAESRLALLPEGEPFRPIAGTVEEALVQISGNGQGPGGSPRDDNHLLDVVLEATGNPAAIAAQPRLLRPHGRLVLMSSPRGAAPFDFHDGCNRRSLTIVGAHGFSHPPDGVPDRPWSSRRHGELFLELLAAGEVEVKGLLTHRFPATDAPAAYRLLTENRSGAMGVLLEW